MKTTMMMASALALTMFGTGCATKKYVAKTVSPVEARVTTAEGKNTEQDTKIADQNKHLGEVDTDLSRTKERLTDTDAKATAAGQAAQQAGQKADTAQKSADDSRAFAQQGLQKADERTNQLERTVDAMNKYQMATSVTVLFPVGQSKLNKDGKAQLDDFAKTLDGKDRYMVEVQGFTDKTGDAVFNEQLSQARAQEVSRYLANEHKIPLRSISMLGSGYALPVADDKTRDGRKQNRRVEIRLFLPQVDSAGKPVAAAR